MRNDSILRESQTKAPGRLIYLALQGSRLFGAHRTESDYDYKGVFLPPLVELLDGRQKDAVTFKSGDSEVTLWSLPFWLRLLANGDTNAIDLYFAHTHPEAVVLSGPEMERLWENCPARAILPKALKGMRSFARAQAIKYGAKGDHYTIAKAVLGAADRYAGAVREPRVRGFWEEYGSSAPARDLQHQFPEKLGPAKAPDGFDCLKVLDKLFHLEAPLGLLQSALRGVVNSYGARAIEAATFRGADWKALSHSLRVLEEVIELHRAGAVRFPLPTGDLQRRIKLGQVDYDEVLRLLEQKELEATEAEAHSVLSENGNRGLLDRALLEVYGLLH